MMLKSLQKPSELLIKTTLLISAHEAWPESAWEEAVWFDDEANILRTLCCWRGPREDQTNHWPDAEVS